MKAVEMKAFRLALEQMRARLRGDVSAMADVALHKTRLESSGDLSSMPTHMADVGTDAYEQEFTLTLMALWNRHFTASVPKHTDCARNVTRSFRKNDWKRSLLHRCAFAVPKSTNSHMASDRVSPANGV